MDKSLIGSRWFSIEGNYFQIDNFDFDKDNVVVYYHRCENPKLSYSCYFEAFKTRFTQDGQNQCTPLKKFKQGLVF